MKRDDGGAQPGNPKVDNGEGSLTEPVPAVVPLLCAMSLMLGGASFACIEDANHDGPHELLNCWSDINGRTRTTTALRMAFSFTYDIAKEKDVLFVRSEEEARADALKALHGEDA